MKAHSLNAGKVLGISMGFSILVLLVILTLAITSNKETTRSEYTQNVATLPSPISTVYATVGESSPTVQVSPQPSASVQADQQVGQGNFGVWSYTAVRRNGQVVAGVRYDNTSIAALQSYALANSALANQLALGGGEVEVHITFRTYIVPTQFRSWVVARGLHVKESNLRVVQENDLDGTMGIRATESDPLPQVTIDDQLQQVNAQTGVRSFSGVYFTRATVNANQLPAITADPLVFLADVTPNVVRNELTAAGVTGAGQALVGIGGTSAVHQPSPFWKMEHDFGLENFQITTTPTIPVPTIPMPTITISVP